LGKELENRHMSEEKIRLLHLVQSLEVGGAEKLLFHTIKALGTEHYKHYVYCFGHDGPVRRQIEALGIPVCIGKKRAMIKRPVKFVKSLIALTGDLIEFLRNRDIQIIQSHLGHANQLAVLVSKMTGIHAFPTVHSTMALADKRSLCDPRVALIKLANQIIYRWADKIIVVSGEIKKIIQRAYGLDDSKIQVLKNGIVTDEHLPESMALEGEFPDSVNKLKIIAVGRLVASKGFDVLIRAVAELVKQGINGFWVMLVGEGEEEGPLQKLVRELNMEHYVKLTGLRQDVIQLMKASDIYVMPSRYEGLSIAMIEAMACALPIVGSDAPGVRDFVVDGENGIRFHTDDVSGLAECIRRLANDQNLRARLSRGARRCFERNYDMRPNVKSLDRLFRQYAACGLATSCSVKPLSKNNCNIVMS